ncbi:MAG: hypothetical protein DME34_08345 [Verrucomicrobia bacterium]|nr:MAG: hypothetical protein DME34_08345 [Verrucomicrobiota bacterium]
MQHRHPRRIKPAASLLLITLGFLSLKAHAANWQASLSKDPPGDFPEPRPLRANYVFGWSGITAATAEVHFTQPGEDRFQLEGTGRTVGLVRALWRLDLNYRAIADANTLRPVEVNQVESYRWKKLTTHLTFTSSGVRRVRTDSQATSPGSNTPKDFNFSNLYDLHAAMLYLRSQPLHDRSVYRIAVYPATSAYLATVSVVGREKISVRAGSYNAIKCDLRLNRIGKNLELQPHRKFRRASIWVSDDSDRVLLRAEAQIFVGSVFAELRSIHFETARP